jgi:hypothetical protein
VVTSFVHTLLRIVGSNSVDNRDILQLHIGSSSKSGRNLLLFTSMGLKE